MHSTTTAFRSRGHGRSEIPATAMSQPTAEMNPSVAMISVPMGPVAA